MYNNFFRPVNLKCEFVENALGVDVYSPDLSWTIETADPLHRGFKQTAYQVLVATSLVRLEKNQADLWDSGKVNSDKMTQISYSGAALQSSKKCFWKVRIWDEKKKVSTWCDPAFWITGILKEED